VLPHTNKLVDLMPLIAALPYSQEKKAKELEERRGAFIKLLSLRDRAKYFTKCQ